MARVALSALLQTPCGSALQGPFVLGQIESIASQKMGLAERQVSGGFLPDSPLRLMAVVAE